MADRRVDPCTLSTPADQILTTKFTLDWDVDFEKKTISGNVKLDVKILKDGVGKLVRTRQKKGFKILHKSESPLTMLTVSVLHALSVHCECQIQSQLV